MHVMNNCLFVDCEHGRARESILGRASSHGGRHAPETGGVAGETLRVDFDELPPRITLMEICGGSVRAASLADAELEWIAGGPIGPGRLLWTITETETPGDPNDSSYS